MLFAGARARTPRRTSLDGFPQYVLGPDYLNLAGNNERFLPTVARPVFPGDLRRDSSAWAAVDLSRLPASNEGRAACRGRVLLPIATVLVFGRYAPALGDRMSAKPSRRTTLPGRGPSTGRDRPAGTSGLASAGERGGSALACAGALAGPRRSCTRSWPGLPSSALLWRPWRSRCTFVTTRRCPRPRWRS